MDETSGYRPASLAGGPASGAQPEPDGSSRVDQRLLQAHYRAALLTHGEVEFVDKRPHQLDTAPSLRVGVYQDALGDRRRLVEIAAAVTDLDNAVVAVDAGQHCVFLLIMRVIEHGGSGRAERDLDVVNTLSLNTERTESVAE